MNQLTDDELGDLLTKSLRSREHLADPDRAVAIAATPGRPRPVGRLLLVSAAAVAVVVGGSAYVVTRGDVRGRSAVDAGPPPVATGSAEAVTRANRAIAEHAADEALAALRARAEQLPGSVEVSAREVPPLAKLMSYIGPGVGQSFTRSAFFVAHGDAREVASWFAAHPPVGSSTPGDATAVGGSRNADGSWSDEALFDYASTHGFSDHGSLASLIQVTPRGSGVGIRATVFASYRPGRPARSFVHDVHDLRIRVTDQVMRTHGGPLTHRRTFLLTGSRLDGVVARYNALPGGAPSGMSCPMPMARRTYRLTFETATGDLAVTGVTGCGSALTVESRGRVVPPYVDGAGFFGFLDRELSLPALPER